jgi:hypothetical protein
VQMRCSNDISTLALIVLCHACSTLQSLLSLLPYRGIAKH